MPSPSQPTSMASSFPSTNNSLQPAYPTYSPSHSPQFHRPPPSAISGSSSSTSTSSESSKARSPTSKAKSSSSSKPLNVFSNDGSFLERFQQNRRDEEDKKKEEDKLNEKRNFEDRFKRRRKRPTDELEDADESAVKKAKVVDDDSAYRRKVVHANDKDFSDANSVSAAYAREVKNLRNSGNLKDTGAGVRSLVK